MIRFEEEISPMHCRTVARKKTKTMRFEEERSPMQCRTFLSFSSISIVTFLSQMNHRSTIAEQKYSIFRCRSSPYDDRVPISNSHAETGGSRNGNLKLALYYHRFFYGYCIASKAHGNFNRDSHNTSLDIPILATKKI